MNSLVAQPSKVVEYDSSSNNSKKNQKNVTIQMQKSDLIQNPNQNPNKIALIKMKTWLSSHVIDSSKLRRKRKSHKSRISLQNSFDDYYIRDDKHLETEMHNHQILIKGNSRYLEKLNSKENNENSQKKKTKCIISKHYQQYLQAEKSCLDRDERSQYKDSGQGFEILYVSNQGIRTTGFTTSRMSMGASTQNMLHRSNMMRQSEQGNIQDFDEDVELASIVCNRDNVYSSIRYENSPDKKEEPINNINNTINEQPDDEQTITENYTSNVDERHSSINYTRDLQIQYGFQSQRYGLTDIPLISVKSNEKPKNNHDGYKIYENFYLIGTDRDEYRQFDQEQSKNVMFKLQPKILYSYPKELNEAQMYDTYLPESILPFGADASLLGKAKKREDVKYLIYEILLSSSAIDNRQNLFVLKFNSEERIRKPEDRMNDSYLDIVNPQRNYYCICVKQNDFIGAYNDLKRVYRCPYVFCFVTQYPFVEFFFDVINQILKQLKLIRTSKTYQFEKDQLIYNIDGSVIAQLIDQELKTQVLESVLKMPRPINNYNYDLLISTRYLDETLNLSIKNYQKYSLLQFQSALTIKLINIDDFILIHQALLLENKVVLFSKQICKISASVYVFEQLFLPFESCFTILSSVMQSFCSEERGYVFEMPTLTGLKKDKSFIQENHLKERYPDVIFYDIDENTFILGDQAQQTIKQLSGFNFKFFRKQVKRHYYVLNNCRSYAHIQNFRTIRSLFRQRQFPENSKTWNHTSAQLNAAIHVHSDFKRLYKIFVINNIPQDPILKPDGNLDQKAISDLMLRKIQKLDQQNNSNTVEFFREFFDTMCFQNSLNDRFNSQ